MSHADTLESYMLRMELPHEQVSDDTWVLAPVSLRHARIIVRIDERDTGSRAASTRST